MRTTRPIALRASPPGSPEPDLTFVAVVHRAMRQDLGRLAACLGQVADRGANPAQARAICALSGLLIAAAGALGPASCAACIRTATALRAE